VTSELLAAEGAWVRLVEEPATTGSIGPGLTAFAVVALLVVATALLARSMLKHVNRVPPSFDDPPPAEAPETEPEPPSAG
jgi:hypothetical protein